MADQIAALKAEVERLRAALEKIDDACDREPSPGYIQSLVLSALITHND